MAGLVPEIDSFSIDDIDYLLSDLKARKMLTETESLETSSKAYSVGSFIIFQSTLYKVTSAISQGDTLAEGVNLEKTSIQEIVNEIYADINFKYTKSREFVTSIETTGNASKAYAIGSYLIYQNILYKVTSAISQGDALIVNTNISETSIQEIVNEIYADINFKYTKSREMLADIEEDDVAVSNHAKDSYLVYKNDLYEILSDISVGDRFVIGTNIRKTSLKHIADGININQNMKYLRSRGMLTVVEDANVATRNFQANTYLVHGDYFYKVLTDIQQGDTLEEGVNIQHYSILNIIDDINADMNDKYYHVRGMITYVDDTEYASKEYLKDTYMIHRGYFCRVLSDIHTGDLLVENENIRRTTLLNILSNVGVDNSWVYYNDMVGYHTVFLGNGDIEKVYVDGAKLATSFNSDGSIIETLYSSDGAVMKKYKTIFNSDGSINKVEI